MVLTGATSPATNPVLIPTAVFSFTGVGSVSTSLLSQAQWRLVMKESTKCEKNLSTEEFIARLSALDLSDDTEDSVKSYWELIIRAMCGHDSGCPDDERSCPECDCHDVRMVEDVIVRVCTNNGRVCCVEKPLIKNKPEYILGTDWMRWQVRHGKEATFIGVIFDIGPEPDDEANEASEAQFKDRLIKAVMNSR
jgi:hypothetical protein